MRRTRLLFLIAVGIAGCTTVNLKAEHVLVGTPGAVYTGTVKVVMDGAPVPGAYEEVAIVTATGAGNAASLPVVLGALQGEAASLGCDTLVRVRYDRGAESATATGVAVRLK